MYYLTIICYNTRIFKLKVWYNVMLEKMGEFFDSRLDGYDEHQLNCINSAKEFYPFTACCLPQKACSCILDLGCGTGLELEYYLKSVPSANITGIDLAPGVLENLRKKFPEKNITLILIVSFLNYMKNKSKN